MCMHMCTHTLLVAALVLVLPLPCGMRANTHLLSPAGDVALYLSPQPCKPPSASRPACSILGRSPTGGLPSRRGLERERAPLLPLCAAAGLGRARRVVGSRGGGALLPLRVELRLHEPLELFARHLGEEAFERGEAEGAAEAGRVLGRLLLDHTLQRAKRVYSHNNAGRVGGPAVDVRRGVRQVAGGERGLVEGVRRVPPPSVAPPVRGGQFGRLVRGRRR
mmetsp:Transcript_323/g.1123  ORF Transcript_323/g.1123 Transcript_323/m.1123 type:complete len:221 (+) Transcript_323:682-1344(+)